MKLLKGKFRLRWLLLAIIIVAFPLAFLSETYSDYYRETSLLEKWKKNGCQVTVKYSIFPSKAGRFLEKHLPPLATVLKNITSDKLFSRIRELKIKNGTLDLNDLNGFHDLQEVTLSKTYGVRSLKTTKDIKIRKLTIGYCKELESIEGLENWSKLTSLSINRCPKLNNLDGLTVRPELYQVSVSECELTSLSGVEAGPNNLELEIFDEGLTSLNSLDGNKRVKNLSINYCLNLKTINLETLGDRVTNVDITECEGLTSIQTEGPNKSQLKNLYVDRCFEVKKIDLSNLKSIETFKLLDLDSLEEIIASENNQSIRNVNLNNLPHLREIESIFSAPNLNSIGLSDCQKIKSIRVLENQRHLKEISIVGCESLADFSIFGQAPQLYKIVLISCEKLKRIQTKTRLKNLRELEIALMPTIDYSFLQDTKFAFLTSLILRDQEFIDLQALSKLQNLKQLRISHFFSPLDLKHLPILENLESIELNTIKEIKNIDRLEKQPNLTPENISAQPLN